MNTLPNEIKITYIISIALMLLFVGFIVFVVMMYNKKQILFQKEKQLREVEHQYDLLKEAIKRQEAIQQERERISHDMHDELGAGISALKLQVEFLKQKISAEDIESDINELLLTAETMNLSMREMLWSLNTENDTMGNFVQYICDYADNFFLRTNIQVQSTHSGIEPQHPLSSEQRRNLLLCVKEAFNNIYKHANAQNVKLSIRKSHNEIQIEILDDGIGLNKDYDPGNGLNNMKIRMKNLNGKFEIKKQHKGLGLLLQMPLKK